MVSKEKVKNKKLSKTNKIFIGIIVVLIIIIALMVPGYVRDSYCKRADLKGELPLRIIIMPECPGSSGQPGDINGDDCVDMADLQVLTDNWLTGCGGSGFCPVTGKVSSPDYCVCKASDLTGDECVNANDFAVLAANWGEGEGCTSNGGSPDF